MPTRASPFVHETSRKTGAPLGNTPPVATRDGALLTEITTSGRLGAAGVVVVGVVVTPDGGDEGVGGTALTGVDPPEDASVAAGVASAGVVGVVDVEVDVEPAGASVTCGRNG